MVKYILVVGFLRAYRLQLRVGLKQETTGRNVFGVDLSPMQQSEAESGWGLQAVK